MDASKFVKVSLILTEKNHLVDKFFRIVTNACFFGKNLIHKIFGILTYIFIRFRICSVE